MKRLLSSLLMFVFVIQLLLPSKVMAEEVGLQSPVVENQQVTFNYQGQGWEGKVVLAGSFNGWSQDATPLTKGDNNIWTVTIPLTTGAYEYKFVADGQWLQDPLNTKRAGDNSLVNVDGSEIDQLYTYNIHYYRFDGQQLNWDMWVWMDGKDGAEYDFTSVDNEGLAVATVKAPQNKINMITRPGDWSSQEVTRSLQMPDGVFTQDFWIKEGDEKIYTKRSDISFSKKVEIAFADASDSINFYTTHEIGEDGSFQLLDDQNEVVSTTFTKIGNNQGTLTLTNPEDFDVQKVYRVKSKEFGEENVRMRGILDDRQYYYDGDDLGLIYGQDKSTFKVWAPTAKEVYLSLYDQAGEYNESGKVEDHTGGQEKLMTREETGVWSLEVEGDLKGKYYMYKAVFANGKVNYAVDPYAVATSANGQRTAVIDLKETNPKSFTTDFTAPIYEPTDSIIYELQVRDFSINENSGMNYKGKYKAFTEVGTNYEGVKTGVDSLQELGVNFVHLLPVYDYATVNELKVDDPNSDAVKFNWGYDPQNYNVPEGSYSTDPQNPITRITEFKEMVQSLHNKNIGVVMDVVYNHTFTIEGSSFEKLVPGYYHRSDDKGKFTNGSGVGNEVASERPMVSKYIVDSVMYWAKEYGIDGFRFDLMKLVDIQTIQKLEQKLKTEVDPSIIIYGEPWSGGATPLAQELQTVKGSQKDKGFAVFNDNIRGAIKGGSDDGSKGFATGESGGEEAILRGVRGAIDEFTNSPSESINYVTAHDNLNLWDKVIKTQGLEEQEGFVDILDGKLKGEDATRYASVGEAVEAATPHAGVDPNNLFANETIKRSLLANGIVLTSQGIPFIHAGEEILRTKFGDHNSYTSPDPINMIRWADKKAYEPVFNYYKGLIELRKAHPAFRMVDKEQVNAKLQVLQSHSNVVSYVLKDFANNDSWKNIVVVYNGNNNNVSVNLPSSNNWKIVVDNQEAGTKVIREFQGNRVDVKPLSMMVLYDEESSYHQVPTILDLELTVLGLEIGSKRLLTATVRDQKDNIMRVQPIFTTDKEEIIEVSSSGRITAKAKGSATVTVAYGDLKETLEVHVADLVPTVVSLQGDNKVYETYTIGLTADIKDQYDQPMLDETITWTSSDTSIATVDAAGRVSGVAVGRVTITAKAGDVTVTKVLTVKKNTRNYIQLAYKRDDENYTDWNLWTWSTGISDGQVDIKEIRDGKAIFEIEVSPQTTQIGFLVRKGTDWGTAKQDITNDRFINVDQNETVTKVDVTSMVQKLDYTYQITGPQTERGMATFYYRDQERYSESKMDEIEGVTLNLGGQQYEMVYNTEEEMYTYQLSSLKEGVFPYTYTVVAKGETATVSDPYNLNDNGLSVFTYEVLDLDIQTNLSKRAVTSDENTVLSFDITVDGEKVEVAEIKVDASAIHAGTLQIDTKLGAQSLAIRDDVTAGIKTLPIEIIDAFGGYHTTSVELEVKPQKLEDEKEFGFDEARIYFMLTDRFNNGDTSNDDPYGIGYDKTKPGTYHGGDFKGITKKLDYLEDLGINTIWITPVVDNIAQDLRAGQDITPFYGYHGYWAKNFEALNPHLGTLEDFHELIDKAHEKGIKIMVDVVLNHVGYGLKSGDSNNVANFPTDEDRQRFEGMLRDEPINGDDEKGELAGLPDLKTEEEAVRNKIIEWQVNWVKELGKTDQGNSIDYFRVDTVKHVEDRTWIAFKNELTKVAPSFKMIGESYGASPDNTLGDLGAGTMDSLLDFGFKYKAKDFVDGNIDDTENYLEYRNGQINNTYLFGQFLGSHDEEGFLTRVGGDVAKLKLAASLQITAKGQPVIYYGEELGQTGENNYPYNDNRYDYDWSKTTDNTILGHYKKLLNIRKDNSLIFSKGTREKVKGSSQEQYLVFKRSYSGEEVYVGLNLSDQEKEIQISVDLEDGVELKDLYADKSYNTTSSTVKIVLPAKADGGTAIIKEVKKIDPPVQPVTFNDLTKAEWARKAIEHLATKGILEGTSRGNYLPYKKITPQQLNSHLEKILGIQLPKLYEGKKNPVITKKEFAIVVSRAIETSGLDLKPVNNKKVRYKDLRMKTDKVKEAVQILLNLGLFLDDGKGYYEPDKEMTRALEAVFLYRLERLINK